MSNSAIHLYLITKSIVILLCSGLSLTACGNSAPNSEVAQETSSALPRTDPVDTLDATAQQTPSTAITSPSETSEIRQATSHTHGDANLAVVLEGTSLTIELETPLFNLTGFEHEPETADELAAMEAAEKKLAQPEGLFAINDEAKCTSLDSNLDIHLGEDEHDEHGEHGDEHDEDEHDEDEHHETEELHQDILITYIFQCEASQKLSEIDITLLMMFPHMTELEVTYLNSVTQRLFTLNQANITLDLRP